MQVRGRIGEPSKDVNTHVSGGLCLECGETIELVSLWVQEGTCLLNMLCLREHGVSTSVADSICRYKNFRRAYGELHDVIE